MPSVEKRKSSFSATQRMRERYYLVDKEEHIHRLSVPLQKETQDMRAIMNTKNYVRIMVQLDKCKYMMLQHYIYCEEDIWVCGDGFVMNVNPDKKIMTQVQCTKTRKECCAHEEGTHEFFSLCPECRAVGVVVRRTDWACKKCGYFIPHDKVDQLPFMKLECEYCPAMLDWDKVDKLNSVDTKFYLNRLELTADMYKSILMGNDGSEEFSGPKDVKFKELALQKFIKKKGNNAIR